MSENEVQRVRRGKWRMLTWLSLGLLVVLLGGEFGARYFVGLGNPILLKTDPEIEYLAVPSRTYYRFGRHIHYNQWSMRSPDFGEHKQSPEELRVLVVGDSIVNGGTPIDDSELATTLLRDRLTREMGRPVVVGNISAGSWGPENQLAYLRRFGLFDADVVVFVWGSADLSDVPQFGPPDFPTEAPVSGLWEGLTIYLPKLWNRPPPPSIDDVVPPQAPPVESCVHAMHSAIELAKHGKARVLVVQHFEVPELKGGENPSHETMGRIADIEQVEVISLREPMLLAASKGTPLYRGERHLLPGGQAVLAEVLGTAIKPLLLPGK